MVDTKPKSARSEGGRAVQKTKFVRNAKNFRGAARVTSIVSKSLKVGNTYPVKVSALSASNIGLNEFSYGFPIYIGGLQQANASLGDLVQMQVLSIKKAAGKTKFVIAKAVKVVKKSTAKAEALNSGKSFDITITKNGPKGTYIAQGPNSAKKYLLHAVEKLAIGDKVNVTSRVETAKYVLCSVSAPKAVRTENKSAVTGVTKGSKFTLVLPKKSKRYLKYIVFKVSSNALNANKAGSDKLPTIVFVKPVTGVKLGDKVQLQVVKSYSGGSLKKANIVIAKIVNTNPLAANTKKAIIQSSVKQMLNSGMHYGEQAIRCNARMKNYVMYSKFGKTKSAITSVRSADSQKNSGARPLIKKGRNIINLLKTRRCLNKALAQLTKYAAKGKTFLFVGTKKAASGLIARASLFSKKAFFVNTRWLGGMLTNWKTIFKSISKIRPILKEKQIIIKDILARRESFKNSLLFSFAVLKKKSKLVIKKGKQLVQKLAKSKANLSLAEKSQKLAQKRKQAVEQLKKGQMSALRAGQLLLQKRKQVIAQSQALYQQALVITNNSKELFGRATLLRKQLRELKALLQISQQVQKVQQTAKQQNKALYPLSYTQYKEFSSTQKGFVIPNPPRSVLNKTILFIKGSEVQGTSNVTKKEAGRKALALTKLLDTVAKVDKFSSPIKASIRLLVADLKAVQAKLGKLQDAFKAIVTQMQNALNVKNQIIAQLRLIKQNFVTQLNIISVIKKKFKQISSQKRLIKFLPKLRYLPTPSTKISQTVQVLMKKIVDPKLKYPIDALYDSKLRSQTKKVAAMRKKKWQRLEKYLGGISSMNIMTSQQVRNTVAIIIGQQEEMNAVRECQKLGIKMFHVVDTNCNPGFADHFIPANDDSRNSVKFVLTQFLTRIRLAQKLKKTVRKTKK